MVRTACAALFCAILSSVAWGQGLSLTGVGGYQKAPTVAGYSGPGDVVSGAWGWWGLRCYANATSASIADVWDSATGNTTETLLTCTAGGTLHETINPLTATCSGGCNVKTLYDQSGSSNCSGPCDATQATNAKRPALTTSCQGALHCATFAAASSQLLSTPASSSSSSNFYSMSFVAKSTSGAAEREVFGYNSFHPEAGFDSSGANVSHVFAGITDFTATTADNALHAINLTVPSQGVSVTVTINVDGTDVNIAGGSVGDTFGGGARTSAIGSFDGGGNYMQGPIFEFGIWQIAFSGTQRTNLCHNQNSYYTLGFSC